MARDDVWTEKQITIVLYEYCRRPFGQFSGTKPFLKELGELINRTPGAIVRKVGNLASFDPQMSTQRNRPLCVIYYKYLVDIYSYIKRCIFSKVNLVHVT